MPDTTQVAADSVAVAPDSVAVVPDSLAEAPAPPPGPPVGYRRAEPGRAIVDTMLAQSFERDAPGVLAVQPASFVYDFGAFGWPNGWSPYGLNPQRVALLLDGLPFDDLVTGRPRYDLLPFSFLERLRVQAGRYGAAQAVYAQVRPYDVAEPLTELHYRTGGTLQSIYAMHTQRHRLALFGKTGVMRALFGYGGHAARGEYDGSRLQRMRQLLFRMRYQQPGWSIDVTYFHNRRRLGAHSGVIPRVPYDAIYNRLIATVHNPDAQRKTIRDDLSLTARARLVPGLAEPLTISAFWTAQSFRYRNPGADTLETRIHRFGARMHQDFQIGPNRLRLLLEGWTDDLRRGNAFAEAGGLSRSQVHVTLRDSLRLGRLAVNAEGGLHVTDHATFFSGAVGLTQRIGSAAGVFAEAWHAGQSISWIEEYGFGRFVDPVDEVPDGRVSQARAGVRLRAGAFDLSIFGFVHEATSPLDFYSVGEDSVEARVADAPFRRAGAGGDLGWRRNARRGFYLTAQPSFVHFLDPDASARHARAETALPEFFAQGRLGARYTLFRGDLDLDLSLRGRFWTELRSRTMHAPTGLLVLPGPDDDLYPASGFLPASGTLDVVIEAGLRTATLFLAYDNVLSGTQLIAGNQVVPIYPLPERRLRFGVFWPIKN